MEIPERFLKAFNKAVEEEKAQKGVLAIFATGSFARGEVGRFSDIDLTVILENSHISPLERSEHRYIEDVLVGFRRIGYEAYLNEFNNPLRWLWNVGGIQDIQIAYNPHNVIQEIRAYAESNQPSPGQFREAASHRVVRTVEYVHKLLNAHSRKDWLNLFYAAFIIQGNLAEAMFLLSEIAIKSENSFEEQLFEECQVPDGFYEDYLITKRILGPSDPKKVFRAAIRLFHRTMEYFLKENVFLPAHLATVEGAVDRYKDYISGPR